MSKTPNKIWGKGITQTPSGHLKYKSPKELRDKYVHRVVIERLIEETPYSIRLLLPFPYEVHHMDYGKTNNRPDNLLMVGTSLHSAMTAHGRGNDGRGKFRPKWKGPPEWLPLYDDTEGEVPF